MNDIKGVKRYIAVFSKNLDENGEFPLTCKYELTPISTKFLRKLFNISEEHRDPGERDLIYSYPITFEQALALQPFVRAKIEFEKYEYHLICRSL